MSDSLVAVARIPRQPVVSSFLVSIGYAYDLSALIVELRGGELYEYRPVPGAVFHAFCDAESPGKFYAAQINGKFPARKLTGRCASCGQPGIHGATCADCGTARFESPRPTDGWGQA